MREFKLSRVQRSATSVTSSRGGRDWGWLSGGSWCRRCARVGHQLDSLALAESGACGGIDV